ncbi:MAG: ISAzo13 family transposase [Candidatus Parabeggiatoa sp.]|nr:ISAzo13 family transposase [Candidatus Parabeggiatoa sp.]
MNNRKIVALLREKYQDLMPILNERSRRLWAATEAKAIGHGGQTLVAQATGLEQSTIYAGLEELSLLKNSTSDSQKRIRYQGGVWSQLIEHEPSLLQDLEALVEPSCRGDPDNPSQRTCKSTRHLATALQKQGYKIGYLQYASLLKELGYSRKPNRKTQEGKSHSDRDAQFKYINKQVKTFQKQGQLVISVDAKKKELVGDFKNKGLEWHQEGQPTPVRIYDFIDKELGKVTPYGVYDQTANLAWVSVGTDHDTAEFAVESIHRWWQKMGKERYPNATKLLITADGGGSNGSRNKLWKVTLQKLADETGLHIFVCHFPPGTSKWNKIEHRLFSYISMNWRGRPLESVETIINLIANTTTNKGLKVQAELDASTYPTGIKISDEELKSILLKEASFHGEWNYSFSPRLDNK